MSEAEDKIKKARDRIAKLMNMTVENGCTEDEAASAMAMAAGIAAQLGIELDQVQAATADSKPRKMTEKYKGEELKVQEAFCGEAAASLYGVEFNAPNLGKHGYWFIGREENIELAQTTMLWLIRQVELLYKQHLPKGMTQKARAEFRATFKQACAQRVKQRAWQLMRDMSRDDVSAQAATGQNALVVVGHFKQLKAEIDDYWDQRWKMGKYAPVPTAAQLETIAMMQAEAQQLEEDYISGKKKRPKAPKVKYYKEPRGRTMKTGNGTSAGYEAGNAVKLRQEIK